MSVKILLNKEACPDSLHSFDDSGENLYSFHFSSTHIKVLRLHAKGYGKPRLEAIYNTKHIVCVEGSQFVPPSSASIEIE